MPSKPTPQNLGQRMTSQRKLLLELIEGSNEHLAADELFRRAKEKDARISLSTVYRTLQLFKQEGLVKERHFLNEHHHYETDDLAEHCHLVCRRCGTILEVDNPLIDKLKSSVSDLVRFQITDIEVTMQGYCWRCQQELTEEEKPTSNGAAEA